MNIKHPTTPQPHPPPPPSPDGEYCENILRPTFKEQNNQIGQGKKSIGLKLKYLIHLIQKHTKKLELGCTLFDNYKQEFNIFLKPRTYSNQLVQKS